MKKIILIFIFVFILGVFGYLGFRSVVEYKMDVVLSSEDGTATLTFEKATKEKPGKTGELIYYFRSVKGDNIYEKYIKNHKGYLYSLDENGNRKEGETGSYVLCINHRYFHVKQEERLVIYRELIGAFYPPEGRVGIIIAPVMDEDGFAHSITDMFSWKETAGLRSFEDLVAFYQRTEESLYEIDKENRDIYVSLYSEGKWYPRGAKVHATEAGIEITRIQEDAESI